VTVSENTHEITACNFQKQFTCGVAFKIYDYQIDICGNTNLWRTAVGSVAHTTFNHGKSILLILSVEMVQQKCVNVSGNMPLYLSCHWSATEL